MLQHQLDYYCLAFSSQPKELPKQPCQSFNSAQQGSIPATRECPIVSVQDGVR